jgi:hypothetical protein
MILARPLPLPVPKGSTGNGNGNTPSATPCPSIIVHAPPSKSVRTHIVVVWPHLMVDSACVDEPRSRKPSVQVVHLTRDAFRWMSTCKC